MGNATHYLGEQVPARGLLGQLLEKASTASASSNIVGLVVLAVLVCSITRLWTGLQCNLYSDTHVPGQKPVGLLPYWIPYLGHAFSFFTRFQDFLGDVMITIHAGTFSLNLANSKINIISAPSLAKQVLSAHAPVSSRDMTYRFMETAWGDEGSVRAMDPDIIFGTVHRVLYQLNREPFVSHAIKRTAASVEKLADALVDFSRDRGPDLDLSVPLWERSGHVKIMDGAEALAEASLYPLIRDFVGSLALPALMGDAFCRNFPDTLPDLWTFDAQVNLMLAGLPRWLCSLHPGLSAAINARARLCESVAEFEDAICDHFDGKEPTERWGDLSDVSNVMEDRAKVWRSVKAPRVAYGSADASLMWAMMVNANQVIFWMLWHVYSHQQNGLLADIRAEIRDFVKIDSPEKGNEASGNRNLKIDIDGLMTKCPLLESTFLETMRMNSFSTSFKKINHDFTVTESAEDAAILGKMSGPQSYTLPQGEMICVPNGAHQMDRRFWSNPTTFDARRFLLVNDEKAENGKPGSQRLSVQYGTMAPWGGGPTKCKGQKFAEREVVVFLAAILTLWEIEPVGGKWVDPGRKMGAGTVQPKADVLVTLRRRVVD